MLTKQHAENYRLVQKRAEKKTQKVEKRNTRRARRLATTEKKTHLDLDSIALDGNPARKIRGLQFSSRGHRSARRGARSSLDGERELDVRDRESLLVGC